MLRNSHVISRGNVRSKFAERNARASPRKQPLRSYPGTPGPVRNAVVFYARANSAAAVSHFLHVRRTLFMRVYIKRANLRPTAPLIARPTYRENMCNFLCTQASGAKYSLISRVPAKKTVSRTTIVVFVVTNLCSVDTPSVLNPTNALSPEMFV